MKYNILKRFASVFVSTALLFSVGCTETDQTVDDTLPPSVKFSAETIEFDSEGNPLSGEGTIDIITNRYWDVAFEDETAVSDWKWKVDKAEGNLDGTIALKLTPSGEARETNLIATIYSFKGEAYHASVKISQGAPEDVESSVDAIVGMMGTEEAVLSQGAHNVFKAVVTAASKGGIIYVQEAADAKSAIALVATPEEAAEYVKGDELTIKVPALVGSGFINNGAPQLTYSTLEVTKGENVAVTPVSVSVSELLSGEYANMFVEIANASPKAKGEWTDGETDGVHAFTAGGADFTVLAPKDEAALLNVPFVIKTGAITGIATNATVTDKLIVHTGDDVKPFLFTDPFISLVTPNEHTFAANADSQDFEITSLNLKGKTLTIEGLSSHYTATVNLVDEVPASITVKAAANVSTTALAAETASIKVDGTELYTFTVAQKGMAISVKTSNVGGSSFDAAGVLENVTDYSALQVGIEYIKGDGSSFDGAEKISATAASSWMATIPTTTSTQYAVRAYVTDGSATLYSEAATVTTIEADIEFWTIPQMVTYIVENTQGDDFTVTGTNFALEQDVKIRGVVATNIDAHNYNAGSLSIVTEGSKEANNGLIIALGSKGATFMAGFYEGEEVIVTLKKNASLGRKFEMVNVAEWGDGKTGEVFIEKTGRTGIVNEPIVINSKEEIFDYVGQPVTLRNAQVTASFSTSDNQSNWIVKDAAGEGIGAKTWSDKACIFKGATLTPGTGEWTGIAGRSTGSAYISPRSFDDIKDFSPVAAQ